MKTVAGALLSSAVFGALLVWLVVETQARRGAWTPGAWVAGAATTVCLTVLLAGAGLVAGGGLVALRRTAREARGEPYAPREPREWIPGPTAIAMRRMLASMLQSLRRGSRSLDLLPGEWVVVKRIEEILATLDDHGALDGLPFMPEMSAFCGGKFRVFRRADKINDWVRHSGLRRPRHTVLLEGLRCDGRHHGGCQAWCHLRWNEAWLTRADVAAEAIKPQGALPLRLGESDLVRLAGRADDSGAMRYVCQVTELGAGTTPLAWWDPRHYLRDLVLGNVRLGPLLVGVSLAAFNRVQRARGGVGSINYATLTQPSSPHQVLGLRPGEVVRVRSKLEIEATLNSRSRNRGLWFDAEMVRFCGGEYRVLARVEKVVEESTGKLIHLSNPCIILDGVTASGEYQAFCAQNEAIFWREIWLERVTAKPASS